MYDVHIELTTIVSELSGQITGRTSLSGNVARVLSINSQYLTNPVTEKILFKPVKVMFSHPTDPCTHMILNLIAYFG
jgi:hypothetical protein